MERCGCGELRMTMARVSFTVAEGMFDSSDNHKELTGGGRQDESEEACRRAVVRASSGRSNSRRPWMCSQKQQVVDGAMSGRRTGSREGVVA